MPAATLGRAGIRRGFTAAPTGHILDPTVTVFSSRSRLSSFWDEPVFSVAGTDYQGIDVALAAMARGDWSAFERRLEEGLACAAHAACEGTAPSADDLESAANDFRYERELIAAAEINAWLERHTLSVDDWMSYLARDLLRVRYLPTLDDLIDRHPPSSSDLESAAYVDGICSGVFDEFDAALAARAALTATVGDDATAPANRFDTTAARIARVNARWLSARPPEDTRVRLERVLRMESHYQEVTAAMVSPSSLADVVQSHRLEWQQLELDTVSFATEHAAREAMLCVSVDRLSLHDVAALSRQAAERRMWFLDEIDSELRDRLVAVEPGGVLGPVAVNGHFDVTSMVKRTLPSLGDPRVAERAREVVVDAAVRRAVQDRVVRPARG